MGEVWLARNLTTGADVALKRCRDDVPSEDAAARFRREAQLGAMLSHRGIVRIFDLVEDTGGPPLLVMELLRGETLESRLAARGALPGREALAIALPVLSALAHAHDRGVLHRDVTPANVFLAVDPDGHVTPKLVDFGVAKLPAAGAQTLDGRVLGTPRYMAPERIRSAGDIDGRSDCFSVGVVLYEMLTGFCPFGATTPSASLAAVLEAVVDPDPRIEPLVWLEVQRALSKRPYERHASAREMSEALRLASGETEASLAECLRAAPPSDDRRDPTGATPTTRGAGPSFGRTGAFRVRRGTRAALLLGGTVVAGFALLSLTTRPRAPSASAPVMASASESASVAASTTPTTSTTTSTTTTTTASASASAPASHRPRVPRTKPVATTPGF
jgi:serine/threonine-protein kinase